jgi:hypothetical protein
MMLPSGGAIPDDALVPYLALTQVVVRAGVDALLTVLAVLAVVLAGRLVATYRGRDIPAGRRAERRPAAAAASAASPRRAA